MHISSDEDFKLRKALRRRTTHRAGKSMRVDTALNGARRGGNLTDARLLKRGVKLGLGISKPNLKGYIGVKSRCIFCVLQRGVTRG